jgi:ribosomal-protein-alanine N-acetyltransferase
MEKMPYRDEHVMMTPDITTGRGPAAVRRPAVFAGDWRRGLPQLDGESLTLRELEISDAPTLLAMLGSEEVARFISPPPTTIDGFERFIRWTQAEREAGRYVCFGIVPHGLSAAVGLFQVRQTEPGFATAEWGFALGSAFWGQGLFMEGAQLVLDFSFDVVGVHRLEARAAVRNGRGNGALRKLGAVQEGILRRSLLRNGEYLDQVFWAILDSDRAPAPVSYRPSVH